MSAALAVGAMTRVGSVRPLGKWAARVSYPLTDSACTRNCSVCDRPIGVLSSPVHSTASPAIATTATLPGLSGHRSGNAVPNTAVGKGFRPDAAG